MTVAIKAPVSPVPPKAAAPTPSIKFRYLELALYKIYNRMGSRFEKGKVYQFTPEQAVILLGEQDAGRAIWKVFRKPLPEPTPVQKIESNIVDATKLTVTESLSDDTMPALEAIEIGNDEEIAEILAAAEDEVPV